MPRVSDSEVHTYLYLLTTYVHNIILTIITIVYDTTQSNVTFTRKLLSRVSLIPTSDMILDSSRVLHKCTLMLTQILANALCTYCKHCQGCHGEPGRPTTLCSWLLIWNFNAGGNHFALLLPFPLWHWRTYCKRCSLYKVFTHGQGKTYSYIIVSTQGKNLIRSAIKLRNLTYMQVKVKWFRLKFVARVM